VLRQNGDGPPAAKLTESDERRGASLRLSDDDVLVEQQLPLDQQGGLVVRQLLPSLGRDELRHDDRDDVVRCALALQLVDVVH
jgi:hypothetical protein